MGRLGKLFIILTGLGLLAWYLARPQPLDVSDLPDHQPDPANGELMFHAGGCASCHGKVVEGEINGQVLAGGLELASPVGVFRAPNISPHVEDGIGGWTDLDFVNAMQLGIAPDGRHYYPSFPYTSYARMRVTDLLDLKAYLDSLPAISGWASGNELSLPFRMRWTLGLWKRVFLNPAPVIEIDTGDEQLARGRYLVEGPGHCGECHTPRNFAMAVDRSAWLAGAPLPEGEGKASNLTPTRDGLAGWPEDDLVYFLETGVDPDFDVVGGPMVAVQENMAKLSDADRQAIAAYLKALPPSNSD